MLVVGALLAACGDDRVATPETARVLARPAAYDLSDPAVSGPDGAPLGGPACLAQIGTPDLARTARPAGLRLNVLGAASAYDALTTSNTGFAMFEAGAPATNGTVTTRGLTDDGHVLADLQLDANGVHNQPYLWREGETWTALPLPDGAQQNVSRAVNNSREVAGHAYFAAATADGTPAGYTAWIWRPAGGLQLLGRPAGATESFALAINDHGAVAGYARVGGLRRLATWANGTWTVLGAPVTNREAIAQGMNNAGWVAGFHYPNSSSARAFVWRPGLGFQDLDRPAGSTAARAIDVNDAGQIAGWAQMIDGSYRGWVWQNGAYTMLGSIPGSTQTFAFAISENGIVAGYSVTASDGAHAVAWKDGDAGALGLLDLGKHTDACSSLGAAINNRYQVAGHNYFGGTTSTDPVRRRAARWDLGAPNAPPSAPAVADVTEVEGTSVTVTATGTNDPDGDALTYTWDFGDGSPAVTTNAPTASHTYADNGAYPVTLSVGDGKGGTSSAAATATIRNAAPVPTAEVSAASLACGQDAALTFRTTDAGVNDRDWSYTVAWGDGQSSTGTLATLADPVALAHAYGTNTGTFTLAVTVTDKDGAAGSTTAEVTNTCRPNAPPAPAVNGPYHGVEGSAVAFSAAGSSDPDGDALAYSWNFGDGNTGSGASPNHAYADNGVYPVTLTVSDGKGGSATVSTTATIDNANPAPTLAPHAQFVYCNDRPAVTLTFTDAGVRDAAWKYAIAWGDGTVSTGNASAQSGAITVTKAAPYPQGLLFVVTATVTDKDGGQGTAVAKVLNKCRCRTCVRSQGYWKTHQNDWPEPFDPSWKFLKSGPKSVTWGALMTTAPSGGNSYVKLAHQWIAATLNVGDGAAAPPEVLDAIVRGKLWLHAKTGNDGAVPHVKDADADRWAAVLEQYNTGKRGVKACR